MILLPRSLPRSRGCRSATASSVASSATCSSGSTILSRSICRGAGSGTGRSSSAAASARTRSSRHVLGRRAVAAPALAPSAALPHALPALAADLVRRQVAVIAGQNIAMRAARAATSTIPIVFVSGGDPVATGLVTNLSRPGGNITGVSFQAEAEVTKRLELLHELGPSPATIAWLRDPNSPTFESEARDVESAARGLGRHLLSLNAESPREIDAAFATIVQSRAGALLIGGSVLFSTRRRQLAALAARHGV